MEKIRDMSVLNALEQQGHPAIDDENCRWIRCKICGKVAPIKYFWTYGGIGEVNLGKCYDCLKPKVGQIIYFIAGNRIYRGKVFELRCFDKPAFFVVEKSDGTLASTANWSETKEIATEKLKAYWDGPIIYID